MILSKGITLRSRQCFIGIWLQASLHCTLRTCHLFYAHNNNWLNTSENCSKTLALNVWNPSWTWGSLRAKDRKWVKGCFLRKPSISISSRVTAEETAFFWEPVTTVGWRMDMIWGRIFAVFLWVSEWDWEKRDLVIMKPHQFLPQCPAWECWLTSLCRTQDACVSRPSFQ